MGATGSLLGLNRSGEKELKEKITVHIRDCAVTLQETHEIVNPVWANSNGIY
jgi:hypothetical protein